MMYRMTKESIKTVYYPRQRSKEGSAQIKHAKEEDPCSLKKTYKHRRRRSHPHKQTCVKQSQYRLLLALHVLLL